MDVRRNIDGPQVMTLRNERGWSQQKLAWVCQLNSWDASRGVVARIEGGIRWVADCELLELVAALRVAVPALYPKAKRAAFWPKR